MRSPASSPLEPVQVAVQRVSTLPDFPLPERKTGGAAGADLQASIDQPMRIEAGQSALVPSGIAIALPPGYEAQVRPRSGLALKHQITVLNSPGTIDADYRGEIGVVLINHGSHAFVVEPLMRIAQLVIAQVPDSQWRVVDDLQASERGAGGFGSTGV